MKNVLTIEDEALICKEQPDDEPNSESNFVSTILKVKKTSSARRTCYKQYTMANMWAALERIEQGLSVYRASIEYGVPRKTLRNWMKKYNIMSYFDLRRQQREKQDVDINEKAKSEVNPDRSSIKCQVRHQEHNYTNPPKEEAQKTTTVPKEEAANYQTRSSSSSGDSSRSKNSSVKVSSHSRSETNSTRQTSQPSSSVRNLSVEVKSRVIKKDVFNRIRRSEEELQKAAEMVRGGMTFQTASDTFNIPISTIRFYMARRGILPQRRRGRGSSGVRDDDLIHPPFEIIHYRLPDIDKPV
ncbi:hypothetical protein RUM43_001238 [Polyplax serrata]|uniref:HTH psq-type domain-containing protein n=1 Tax=Polyplax serrata TaxID=468196 RepID=A0AAN8SHE8_POLSC